MTFTAELDALIRDASKALVPGDEILVALLRAARDVAVSVAEQNPELGLDAAGVLEAAWADSAPGPREV